MGRYARPARRRRVSGDDANGRSFEATYDDFAEADGLVYPKKIVYYHSGSKYVEMETTEFKFLDEVDEAIFEKP